MKKNRFIIRATIIGVVVIASGLALWIAFNSRKEAGCPSIRSIAEVIEIGEYTPPPIGITITQKKPEYLVENINELDNLGAVSLVRITVIDTVCSQKDDIQKTIGIVGINANGDTMKGKNDHTVLPCPPFGKCLGETWEFHEAVDSIKNRHNID